MSQKPNQLIHEKSPYLLQHSYNPVNWFAWSEKAFTSAKKEDKPVLLSIGYSTCHWCHVMEKESFENQEIATYLNKHFISIKVDREERPDIDKVYMDALSEISQQSGGWPLNMFLTPDKNPIIGGTYFPPRSTFHHQGFLELLQSIIKTWQNQKDDIVEYSKSLSQHLQKSHKKQNVELSEDCFHNSFRSYQKFFDQENFGFKWNGKNKFPPFLNLNFLLQYGKDYQNSIAVNMVKNTLKAIKKGGIYDQLGGGVCRYSTDHFWLVPHFEKMLYDNSLFLRVLSDFYAYSKDNFFKEAAYDVIHYIEKNMRLVEGGIASAEDADSEGVEGKFYLWSFDEVKEVCGEDFPILQSFWNITAQGNFEGKNILHETLKVENQTTIDIIDKNKEKLLQKRNQRVRPFKDDKILTSWNALYLQSLAKSAMIFSDKTLIDLAEKTFTFLQNHLILENRVFRRFRENEVRHKGYINDYAELILAAIFLYFATLKIQYIQFATDLMENAIELFYSKKGFFKDTGNDADNLIKDSISSYDGVEPSGNSSMAQSLILLNSLGVNQEKYQKILESIFIYFSQEISVQGTNVSYLLSALMNFGKMKEFVIIAKKEENKELQEILKNLRASYLPNMVLAFSLEQDLDQNKQKIPLLENRKLKSDFCIYYCENKVCQLPVYSWEELKKYL